MRGPRGSANWGRELAYAFLISRSRSSTWSPISPYSSPEVERVAPGAIRRPALRYRGLAARSGLAPPVVALTDGAPGAVNGWEQGSRGRWNGRISSTASCTGSDVPAFEVKRSLVPAPWDSVLAAGSLDLPSIARIATSAGDACTQSGGRPAGTASPRLRGPGVVVAAGTLDSARNSGHRVTTGGAASLCRAGRLSRLREARISWKSQAGSLLPPPRPPADTPEAPPAGRPKIGR